jgi:hypothetical protein
MELSLGYPANQANLVSYPNMDQGGFAFYPAQNWPTANNYTRVLDIVAGAGNTTSLIRFITQASGVNGGAGNAAMTIFSETVQIPNGPLLVGSSASGSPIAGDMSVCRNQSTAAGYIYFGTGGAYFGYTGSGWTASPALPGGAPFNPHDVTGSRALGSNYGNSTGGPMIVTVYISSANSSTMTVTVNGIQIFSDYFSANISNHNWTFPVPNGGNYTVANNASATVGRWVEWY